MSQQLDWQCLTVQNFFTQHNWSGKKSPQTLDFKPETMTSVAVEMAVEAPLSSTDIPSVTQLQTAQTVAKTAVVERKSSQAVSWQCLTVEDFFRQNNWSGRLKELVFEPVLDTSSLDMASTLEPSLSNLPTINTNPTEAVQTTSETSSQKSFSAQKQVKSSVFSLTLSVQDFWEMMEWEGQPAIALLPEVKPKKGNSESSDEITLDDLFDLF
jgi:hypothetical protein